MERAGHDNPLQNESADREQRAKVLASFLRTAEHIEPFHGQRFEEVFASEESKRKFINGLTPEEFVELLNGLNGLLRHKDRSEWSMDGETVLL